MDLPIACTLSSGERTQRAESLLSGLARDARWTAIADGYRAEFVGTPGTVDRLARVIEQERACCKFLSFALEAAPSDGPVHLVVSGPPGTQEFLRDLLAIS
jgi:hypothetical protein